MWSTCNKQTNILVVHQQWVWAPTTCPYPTQFQLTASWPRAPALCPPLLGPECLLFLPLGIWAAMGTFLATNQVHTTWVQEWIRCSHTGTKLKSCPVRITPWCLDSKPWRRETTQRLLGRGRWSTHSKWGQAWTMEPQVSPRKGRPTWWSQLLPLPRTGRRRKLQWSSRMHWNPQGSVSPLALRILTSLYNAA